jgi:LysM repeat protein
LNTPTPNQENNMNETTETPKGTKLSTIFLVVLGLHIAVIVTISAYHLLRGASPERLTRTEATLEKEATELAADAGQAPGQVAIEHETPAPLPGDEVASQPMQSPEMPMPPAGDSVWENPGSALPDPAADQAAAAAKGPELAPVQNGPAFEPAFAAQAPAAPVAKSGGAYTVKKGDTLGKIARNHGVSVAALRDANGLKNDTIRLGQTLNLPGSSSVAAAPSAPVPAKPAVAAAPAAPTSPAPGAAASSFLTYKVSAGDTLWKIAKTFNTKPAVIVELNGIKDPSTLKPGQTLKVPSNSTQAEADAKAAAPKPQLRQADLAMGKQN